MIFSEPVLKLNRPDQLSGIQKQLPQFIYMLYLWELFITNLYNDGQNTRYR